MQHHATVLDLLIILKQIISWSYDGMDMMNTETHSLLQQPKDKQTMSMEVQLKKLIPGPLLNNTYHFKLQT